MILIRHGQSEFNVVYGKTRVDPGIRDPRLTALGERQAQARKQVTADTVEQVEQVQSLRSGIRIAPRAACGGASH